MTTPPIPTLRTWCEGPEPNSPDHKYKDCTQCSYLMALIFGGIPFSKFAKGVYTVAERERFEDAEGLPEPGAGAAGAMTQETGLPNYHLCDVAAAKLYGITAHPATEAQLPALLARTDVAVALPGQGAGLPAGPGGYTGLHCVTFVPIGDGRLWSYDPLAMMGDGPEVVATSTIIAWHARFAVDIRYAVAGEFAPVPAPTSRTITVYHGDTLTIIGG